MGRGSGGVAQTKGKSYTTAQTKSARNSAYRKIRAAVESNKGVKATEDAYANVLRGATIADIETAHKNSLNQLMKVLLEPNFKGVKLSEPDRITASAIDKMAAVEAAELRRRDPEKYPLSWDAQMRKDIRGKVWDKMYAAQNKSKKS